MTALAIQRRQTLRHDGRTDFRALWLNGQDEIRELRHELKNLVAEFAWTQTALTTADPKETP